MRTDSTMFPESDKSESETDSDDGPDVDQSQRNQLRGLGRFFYNTGAYDKYSRPRWAHQAHHFLALGSGIIAFAQVTDFSNSVAQYGGWAFVLVYAIVNALLGFPVLTLEILLGQFSGRNTVEIFRRLCPLSVGVGWASVFVSLVKLIFTVPTLGIVIGILSMVTMDPQLTCGNLVGAMEKYIKDPNISACYNFTTRHQCEKNPNQTAGSFYFKGDCYGSNEAPKFLQDLDSCLKKPLRSFARAPPAEKAVVYDLIQRDNECGWTFRFDFPTLQKTEWFQYYNDSGFLLAKESCSDRKRGFWRLLSSTNLKQTQEARLQLLPDITLTRFHSPFATAQRLKDYLRKSHSNLTTLISSYCRVFDPNMSLWACLQEHMIVRESPPNVIFVEHIVAQRPAVFGIDIEVLGITLFAWILIYLPTIKGPSWLAFTLMTTCFWSSFCIVLGVPPSPQTLSSPLFKIFYGMGLEGFTYGVQTLGRAEWCRVLDPYTWVIAVWQNMLNIPVGSAMIPVISSYSPFKQDAFAHAMGVSAWSFCFSVLCCIFNFGYIGIIAHQAERKVEEFILPIGEIFGALLSRDLNLVHFGTDVSVIMLLAFIFLGISAAITAYETIICHVSEHLRYLTKRRPMGRLLVGFIVTVVCGVLGVPSASSGNSTWVELLMLVMVILLLINSVLTVVVVMYVYGWREWDRDLRVMFEREEGNGEAESGADRPVVSQFIWNTPLRYYFQAAWLAMPAFLLILLTWYVVATFNDSQYAEIANADDCTSQTTPKLNSIDAGLRTYFIPSLYVIYALILVIPALLLIVKKARKRQLRHLLRVGHHWVPADPTVRLAFSYDLRSESNTGPRSVEELAAWKQMERTMDGTERFTLLPELSDEYLAKASPVTADPNRDLPPSTPTSHRPDTPTSHRPDTPDSKKNPASVSISPTQASDP